MIVVADSSPFVVLIAIGHGDLLAALFQRIIVPNEVAAELGSPKRPEAVLAFIAAPPAWFEVRTPVSPVAIPGLHPGEASAIALACECRADLLLIDERQGRKEAQARGLTVMGTIGVLGGCPSGFCHLQPQQKSAVALIAWENALRFQGMSTTWRNE